MKHSNLVKFAKVWLKTAMQCNPVFSEKGSAKFYEMPDAIGWNSQGSIIVECKTSLRDFRADAKKPFRIKASTGMGKCRYYVFTKEIYDEIPEKELPKGWGIALFDPYFDAVRRVRFKSSKQWLFNLEAELFYMRNRILEIQRFGR